MRGTRWGRLPAIVLTMCCTAPGSAAELDLGLALPSVLRLSATVDDTGGYDYFLDLDQALPGGQRFVFSYGRGLAVRADGDVEPRTISVGISSDPLDRITVAARVEDWGQEQEIKTRTLRGDARLRTGRWQFGLGARMRNIEIFFLRPLPEPVGDSLDINSEGLELSAGVDIGERWYTALNHFHNDYSRDPGILNLPGVDRDVPIANVTSSVAFSLAAGLQESGTAWSTSLFTDWGAASFDWSQSVSAVDGAESVVLSLGVNIDLTPDTSLQLTAARQTTDDEFDLYLAAAALVINW